MGIYLVMKNNLKRLFANKMTYLLMFIMPVMIVVGGMAGTQISLNNICVGIINQEESILDKWKKFENVQYQIIEGEVVQTDFIMGNYDYIVDLKNESEVGQFQEILQEKSKNEKKTISTFERQIAMLMTAYFVIATLYATKFIADREQGMIERFCMSGRKLTEYLGGYVLSTSVMVSFQVSIAVLGFCMLEKKVDCLKMLAVILMISSITTAYGVVHAFLCKREMTANILASSLAVVLSILGGTFVAVEEMPKMIQFFSVVSPIRWVLEYFIA